MKPLLRSVETIKAKMDKVWVFTSDCRCWMTTVNASNFWLLDVRNFFSCRMIPLWVSHFVLYCVNSAAFVPDERASVEPWVRTHELLGLRCLPLSTKTTTTTNYYVFHAEISPKCKGWVQEKVLINSYKHLLKY